MSYIAGDNNLSINVDDNLQEMQKVGSTPNVNVVGQYDKSDINDTRRFVVPCWLKSKPSSSSGKIEEEELKETDCCDPAVLKKFIDWAVRSYPADHYALVLYGHGWGWEPSKNDPHGRNLKEPKITPIQANQKDKFPPGKQLFRITRKTDPQVREAARATRGIKGFAPDDSTGHSPDTLELGNVVAHAKQLIGKKLDILGLDGCLMSNLEVAYQIKSSVNYLIASEEKAPSGAWPYDRVLKVFNDKAGNSPATITSAVVNEYINFYKELNNNINATQSAFSLEKIEGIAKSVEALGKALLKSMPDAAKEITTALSQSESKSFYWERLWDIDEFAMEISKVTDDPEIKKAARKVQKEIEPGPNKFVLSKSETGPNFDAAWGGLSVYLFYPGEKVSEYYKDLAFTQSHPDWHKMLQHISL